VTSRPFAQKYLLPGLYEDIKPESADVASVTKVMPLMLSRLAIFFPFNNSRIYFFEHKNTTGILPPAVASRGKTHIVFLSDPFSFFTVQKCTPIFIAAERHCSGIPLLYRKNRNSC
jgi:hypothetical protein